MSTQSKFIKSLCFSLTLALLSPSFCLAEVALDAGTADTSIDGQARLEALTQLQLEVQSDKNRLKALRLALANAKHNADTSELVFNLGNAEMGISTLSALGLSFRAMTPHPEPRSKKFKAAIIITGVVLAHGTISSIAGDWNMTISQRDIERLKLNIDKVSSDLDTKEQVLSSLIKSFAQSAQ